MKKNRKVIIAIVGILIITIFTGILVYNNSAKVKVRRQLKLGQKYLEEMNYEQAIVAFEIAIEIDPMSVEAYLGLADSYIGLGDMEKALEVLEEGYERTQDKQILERMEQIREGIEKVREEIKVDNDGEKAETEDNNNYIEFDFSADDFNFRGYSVLEGDHFWDIINENKIPYYDYNDGSEDNFDRYYNESEFSDITADIYEDNKCIFLKGWDEYTYACYEINGANGSVCITMCDKVKSQKEYVNSLFYPNDSMELAKEILKINKVKKLIADNDNYEFESNIGKCVYRESYFTDEEKSYNLVSIEFENWGIRIRYQEENNLIDTIMLYKRYT